MEEQRPNFFDFADSELSHSSLWAWMLRCSGDQADEFASVRDLVKRFYAGCAIPPLVEPVVRRNVNYGGGHIDIEIKDAGGTCVLIENNVRAVSDSAQIEQFYSSYKEKGHLHCILLTTAFDVDARSAARKGAWRYLGLEELDGLLTPFRRDAHWLLREYSSWLEKENVRRKAIAADAKSDEVERFAAALATPEGQWELLAAVMREISGFQYRGTSRGRPWTQFRFVKESDTRDTLFYRLDVPGRQPFLELKQYLSSLPADLSGKQDRLIQLRKLWKKTAAEFPGVKQMKFMHTNDGKECTVARMELHPVSEFLAAFPLLHAAYVAGLKEAGLG